MNNLGRTSCLVDMENELIEFEKSDFNTGEKELRDFIDKMLGTALEIMKNEKGGQDKDLQDNIKKMFDIIQEKDFLDKVNTAVQKASEEIKFSKSKHEKDSSLQPFWFLLKLGRDCYSMIRFKWARTGEYEVLYTLMEQGKSILGDYYNWKTNCLYYLETIIDPSKLAGALGSFMSTGRFIRDCDLCRRSVPGIADDTTKNIFAYVDKAYGESLEKETLARPLSAEDLRGLDSTFYNSGNGSFHLPLGFKGWLGKDTEGSYVVAFSGTQFDAGMIYADIEQAVAPSLIYICAVGMVHFFAQKRSHIHVCGHSLGGGLTQFSVAACDNEMVRGWGFNSAGLSEYSVNALRNKIHGRIPDIEHYVTGGDPVSLFGALLGNLFVLEDSDTKGHSRSDLRCAMGIE